MAVTNFPTDPEITNIQGTAYDWASNEKPVPSSKLNGMVRAAKQLIRFLKDPSPQLVQEDWINAVLNNGWVNFGGLTSPLQYRRNSLGQVEFRGLIKDGPTAQSTVIFVLPPGYRPSTEIYTNTGRVGSIAINPVSGEVLVDNFPTNSSVSFDCIFFSTN